MSKSERNKHHVLTYIHGIQKGGTDDPICRAASQVMLLVKNPPANAGNMRQVRSWLVKIPWSRKWQPLQYSCLENPMDRGALWAIVHRVAKSSTWLKRLSTQRRCRYEEQTFVRMGEGEGRMTWVVLKHIHCCCSVARSSPVPTLCDPMDCSVSGFPVLHYLLELAQTPVHWITDAIQPSHPRLPPSPPTLNFSQHQGLSQWVDSSHQVAKVLELQFQHQSFQWIRVDFL